MSPLVKRPVRFNGALFAKTWTALLASGLLIALGMLAGPGRSLHQLAGSHWSGFLLLAIALLSTTALFAVLATFWIDRPFKKLMTFITEMGRGNFSLRIPEQRNRQMKRLAKLVNYMAEEMDRLPANQRQPYHQ